MAPASPDLRIIMRFWAVSKKALMLQREDCRGWGQGAEAQGKRKERNGERWSLGQGGKRGEKNMLSETAGEAKEPGLYEQTRQCRRQMERQNVME